MQIEKLGPYRIGKQIGKGGMGAVYEATFDAPGEHHGMRVAVKALIPQLAAAEGFRERFEAEIDSLKKLRHDGIVLRYQLRRNGLARRFAVDQLLLVSRRKKRASTSPKSGLSNGRRTRQHIF